MHVCVYVIVCHVRVCSGGGKKSVRFLGARVTGSSVGYWEFSSGLLEEQAVLLNTELPLQLKSTPPIILELRLLWKYNRL